MTYTFGLDTFGDRNSDADGKPLSHAQTIRNVAEEGVFAEQAGVDFFGIGEHHTEQFPMPAADVVLAAIAARTQRVRLGSAVTVLSSDDPVRVFQRYSTLDAISGGRAEVILGRGSSIDSFPLFGYDLADYDELFDEKAGLFAELLKGGPVTWQGKTRAPLLDQDVVPHTESGPFPAWIGVGGNPQSVIRAARLGFGLALAIIGGPPARFARYSELFRRALEQFGRPPLPVLVHSPGHVAATDEQAKAEFWPRWRDIITLMAPERGFAIPTKESFGRETGPHGALYVGSPETVARKIAANLRALDATRFDLKYGMPGLTHDQLMTCIELYGRQVIPRVRELLGELAMSCAVTGQLAGSENVLMVHDTNRRPAAAAALSLSRQAATAVAAGRVVLGVAALARPSVPARPWVGASADELGAQVFGRALGARDVALGLGALTALLKPSASGKAAAAWVAAGALSDALDTAITAGAWAELPPATRWLIAASAGGAAAAGAAGAVALLRK